MGTANQIAFTLKAKINEREVTPDTIGLSLFNQFNAQVEDFLTAGQRKASLEDVRFEFKYG